MRLKEIVDKTLKDKNRSLSWLATEMNKTFDGLKLSLIKESMKYSDIKRMSEILNLPAAYFFAEETGERNILEEERIIYPNLKMELSSCRELCATLKNQLADKEKIIELLSEKR